MSTKSQRVLHGWGRTIILVLLTPITTLNASQALTLCVGHDGRVTIELLVQDRCTCEIRTSSADAQGDAIAGSSRVTDGSGLPCLDIPIPGGSCDNRMRAGPVPTDRRQRQLAMCDVADPSGQAFAYVTPTVASPGGPADGTSSLLASVSYYAPLDNILLQV